MVFGQPALQTLPSLSQTAARTVVGYSAPAELKSERKSLTVSKDGIEVYKVAKNGKLHSRRIALTSNNRCILVTSNKIKSIRGLFKKASGHDGATARSIDISSVERIERGQQTSRFLAAKTTDNLPTREGSSDHDESNCLSIIYRVSTREAASLDITGGAGDKVKGPHRFDTLDMLIPKDEDFDLLCATLEDLICIYKEERKQWDVFSLFLQFHWADLEKEFHRESRLSSGEWIALCDRANVPMKKALLQSYFKEFTEERNLQEEKGLSLLDTADLMAEVKEACAAGSDGADEEENPLMKVWNELFDSDPVPAVKYESENTGMELAVNVQEESISNVAFLSFVRSQQKEFTASIEDVHRLVQQLNEVKTLDKTNVNDGESKERLGKSRFLAYLASDMNDIFDPEIGTFGSNDMEQPLTHYWINTSHDTYLAKLPNSFRFKDMNFEEYHAINVQSYLDALHRGVRCLELDVFDGLLFETPVVARRKPTTSSDKHCIPFSQILHLIRSFLRSNPNSYPIILCLETQCSVKNQSLMAKDLKAILDSEDMLFHPSHGILNNEERPLPSPQALRGKVVVKNKRPKNIREGGFVFNDDLDEENDLPLEFDEDDLEDEANGEDEAHIRGTVIRFEASGPIRSTDPDVVRHSPAVLLDIARHEAEEARQEAARAERKEREMVSEAASAEAMAQSLIDAAGATAMSVKSRAVRENKMANGEDDEESDEETAAGATDTYEEKPAAENVDEGVEVQDFFGKSVEGARTEYSDADAHALSTSEVAHQDLERLTEAKNALKDAEASLEASYQLEKKKASDSKMAANDARANREHADMAKRRVDTVKEMLRSSRNSAVSAETVVVTAMTEAKISEERASETEARASRALAVAEKERTRGDNETNKEEILEQEAADLHERCLTATREAKTTRERLEKAASMLDRVNEQIKLIERSAQFQKERKELETLGNGLDDDIPRHGGNFVAKHVAKLQERQVCTEQIKEASVANQSAEGRRKQLQSAFEEKAHMWKIQSEIASRSRKQADRSSQHAEELAEHAEEEREAATLRHFAREKAQKGVSQSDDYQTSIQAQLVEASRASEEAASLALESRVQADKLAREAEFAKNHSKALDHVANMKEKEKEAHAIYRASLGKKADADSKATDAKRLLDTSSEVFTNAKRDAAAEVDNAAAKRQLEREAVQAHRKALIAKKLVESASLQSKLTKEAATEKIAAEARAEEFKFKMDRRVPVAPDLALLTLLNSTKYTDWEKSKSLPNAQMHSIAQSRATQMVQKSEERQRTNFVDFTKDHFLRVFPSWTLVSKNKHVNCDPTIAHGLGCQLVSMNFQSSDEHLLLNDGRFRANGSSGYVLKPPRLLVGENERSQKWRFTILCGNYLPKGEAAMVKKTLSVGGSINYISPFVRVSLYDRMDSNGKSPIIHETQPASGNGLSPVWNLADEFEFEIQNPAIAVLSFMVADDEAGDFVAGATVPANCLRQGYRSVALFDSLHSRSGPYAYASLVIRAQKIS